MRKSTHIDNFLEFELEMALVNYEDRMFLFNLELAIDNLIKDDKQHIEIRFYNKHKRNLASYLIKRYFKQGESIIIKEQSIQIKENFEEKKPILKLTDFFYKNDRVLNTNFAQYEITPIILNDECPSYESGLKINIRSAILNEQSIKRDKEVLDLTENFTKFNLRTENEIESTIKEAKWLRDVGNLSNKEYKLHKRENFDERPKCKSHHIYKSNSTQTTMTKCFTAHEEERKTNLFIKTDHILYMSNCSKDSNLNEYTSVIDKDTIRYIDSDCCLIVCDDHLHAEIILKSLSDGNVLDIKYLKEAPDMIKEKFKEKSHARFPTPNLNVFNKLVTSHLKANKK